MTSCQAWGELFCLGQAWTGQAWVRVMWRSEAARSGTPDHPGAGAPRGMGGEFFGPPMIERKRT
jgi:hypothetical protein